MSNETKNRVEVLIKKLWIVHKYDLKTNEDIIISEDPPDTERAESNDHYDIEFESINDITHDFYNDISNGKISFKIFEAYKDIYEENKSKYDDIYFSFYFYDDKEYVSPCISIFGERLETDEEFAERLKNIENTKRLKLQEKENRRIAKEEKRKAKELQQLKELQEKYAKPEKN